MSDLHTALVARLRQICDVPRDLLDLRATADAIEWLFKDHGWRQGLNERLVPWWDGPSTAHITTPIVAGWAGEDQPPEREVKDDV